MTTPPEPTASPFVAELTLSKPIGKDGKITTLIVRAFQPSEMFGLIFSLLCVGDVDQMRQLIPRVTVPSLITAEIDTLEACDLCDLIDVITDYIQPTALSDGPIELNKDFDGVKTLMIRTPQAGELRGLQVKMIRSGSVDQMMTLLPRITTPKIVTEDLGTAHMTDFANAVVAVIGFLQPPLQRASMVTMSKT